ncbi:thymocyte selection-associated high mobility group box protein TOX isoform X3 [Hypomesus transpacificus]|uniref:thymocyte selection-associated high mobility group box protein TOX isoform X3 n=1 Tax=Hypomesus transpacificus TaxID=137520 RepID=UPI001F07E48E|nr:thymocyte selection-associated high mobility group box protein TOX isoform X3 [Hypomesus transpacificus]
MLVCVCVCVCVTPLIKSSLLLCLQYDSETMYLGMQEAGLDFMPANQFRVPPSPHQSQQSAPSPHQSQQSAKQTGPASWRRDGPPSHHDGHRLHWSYPGLGDEDFNIPPITPPTIPEHMLHPHLPESESGTYHPLASQSGMHPFHLQGMDLPGVNGSSMMSQDGGLLSQDGGMMSSTLSVMQQMVNSRYTSNQQSMEALRPRNQSGMGQQTQLTTINQSQLGLSGNTHNSPSPPGSKSATPSPSSSVHEDDNDESVKAEKRPAVEAPKPKPKTPKKKKKKDPNEPQKPVSAYALFFRDTQAAIKGQNPNATFGEVSKIVASMWDGLGEEQKQEYKKKTETAKKEYLKQLAAYRASLVSQQSYSEPGEVKMSQSPSMLGSKPPVYHGAGQPAPHQHPHPHSHPGLYMSHPYHHPSHPQHHPSHPQHHPHPQHHQAGLSPHLGLSRGVAPRPSGPHSGGLSLGNMAAASPPPLQISPPLHSHAHLGLHHQQQHSGHSLSLHSPSMGQGFPLQTEFQNMINMSPSGGQGMSPPMEYGRSAPGQQLDWNEFSGNGTHQRDKLLFLT